MVAICVGHSRSGDMGAVSVGGESEWEFWQPLAYQIAAVLRNRNINAKVIDVYDGKGYSASMTWLARHLREIGADLAVELHFNSAGPTAHGYEHLYWGGSVRGEFLAESLQRAHRDHFPQAMSRGAKALGTGSRGALFCRLTPCPAVVVEPFFGSHEGEWQSYSQDTTGLVYAIADGICWHLNP